MIPITRSEQYLATAAGDANAPAALPQPVTREDFYLKLLCDRIGEIAETSAEEIGTAVADYLDEHPAIGRAATDEEFEEAMNND